MRPISIVNFERCYLGALLIGLVNAVVAMPTMLRNPQLMQASAVFGSWYLPTIIGVGFLIPLVLWIFAARRASVVAKWIIVVFFAIAVISMLVTAFRGFPDGSGGVKGAVGVVAFVLQAVSVYLLFQPDAVAWFRGADSATDLGETFR
ncbi:hypothetical protein [uncultured Sphingomonas sp.]|uniref:hypothetical protein n=1 Tax=uncultured Sphingomonas sp. TaxID=158754 RepID=UPI0035CB683C